MADHRDEAGNVCTLHAAPSTDALLALATIGSRMPGFHHDCASKLQSLMMSVEELLEMAQTDDTRQSLEGAAQALRELNELFAANRALAKSPAPRRGVLADVVRTAAKRAGVKVRGEMGKVEIEASPQGVTHAFSLLLDIVAGPAAHGRAIDVAVDADERNVQVVFAGPAGAADKAPPNASELIAIASFVIARDGGELRCVNGGERFSIRLLRAR